MTDAAQADLTVALGELIVEDPGFATRPWVALSLVATFAEGQQSVTGYRYLADGDFEAQIPRNLDEVLDKLEELRNAMAGDQQPWLQCLIQITRPDYDLKLAFEYDDPAKWAPTGVSRDMAAFADALRPGAG